MTRYGAKAQGHWKLNLVQPAGVQASLFANMQRCNFTEWEPTREWLVVEQTTLPEATQGKILIPESARETNFGIVRKSGCDAHNDWIGLEVFWPKHAEITALDTDTKNILTLVKAESIIMSRKAKAQPQFFEVTEGAEPSFRPFETQPQYT